MAAISALITELRTDLSDDASTRFTDTQLLNLFKKAIRRVNRIVQRHGLQFAKKKAVLSTVANQDYITLSTITDFDVAISLHRTDLYTKIPLRTELEWQSIISASDASNALLDYQNDKILLNGTPSSVLTLHFWYFPTVDPSAYTTASTTPWAGRLDDVIMEYVGMRAKNIDEMKVDFERSLLADMENQILQAYQPNAPMVVEGSGWL